METLALVLYLIGIIMSFLALEVYFSEVEHDWGLMVGLSSIWPLTWLVFLIDRP